MALLAILGFGLVLALSAWLRGYVLCVLWGWFIVDTFGLPALTIPQAIGLVLIIIFLTHHDVRTDYKDGAVAKIVALVVAPIGAALAAWFYGWIVHGLLF